mmetsp:Transcript_16636/g.37289  ORF Transcript_16636/g.37289 Transcript_16636/m.37289 type:complete len:214 (-) Transcript_16636:106-747(-)
MHCMRVGGRARHGKPRRRASSAARNGTRGPSCGARPGALCLVVVREMDQVCVDPDVPNGVGCVLHGRKALAVVLLLAALSGQPAHIRRGPQLREEPHLAVLAKAARRVHARGVVADRPSKRDRFACSLRHVHLEGIERVGRVVPVERDGHLVGARRVDRVGGARSVVARGERRSGVTLPERALCPEGAAAARHGLLRRRIQGVAKVIHPALGL